MSDEHPPADDEKKAPTEPISLESLTSAFAQMMGESGSAAESDSLEHPESDEPDDEAGAVGLNETDEEDETPITPLSVLEAMLFVGDRDNRPLKAEAIAEQIRGVEAAEVDALVESLNLEYREQHSAFEIATIDGGYRLRLRDEYARVREKFYGRTKEAKLSQQAIEVLALVAYNQPLSRDEVTEMRGRASGSLLSQLVRRQLLSLTRTEEKPRKTLYSTTGRFLQMFALESIEELPDSPEFED